MTDESPAKAGHYRNDSSRGRLLVGFGVFFVLLVALTAFIMLQRRSEYRALAAQTARFTVPFVAIVHATPAPGGEELVLPGNIQAFTESPIYARTNGYLKKWYRDIGSHVKQGELLAEIDTPEVDAQLAQARAELATAKANVKLATSTAERYEDLLKSNAVSRQDVDNAEGDRDAKKAAVQSAEANVKRLEDLESFKRIYAPFAGVITQRNVDTGTLVNSGNGGNATKPLFELAKTDPLRVFISLPQTYAPTVRAGLGACLELSEYPGRTFCGKVARTSESVDPATRTLQTEIDVANPTGELLPGEFAQVHLDKSLAVSRLTLPNNALLFRPDGTMAAVVGPDQKIILKKLTIGRDLGTSVEILDGLSATDAVVINPPDSLENGQKVSVTGQS